MKYLLAATLAFTLTPIAAAQYPKTITLTVTRITRIQKDLPGADCDNCVTVTSVEAHTATANFVITCEATLFTNGNSTLCASFEIGSYEVARLSPEVISFWPQEAPQDKPNAHPTLFTVRVEEMRPNRTKQ